MNSKFQNLYDNCFWKGPKSIHSFRFKKMSNEYIKTCLGSLPNKSTNDILGMDLVLWRESAPYISFGKFSHWQMWLINPLSLGHKPPCTSLRRVCVGFGSRNAENRTDDARRRCVFWDTREHAESTQRLLPRVRGFWYGFVGVCSLTYCNGNFRFTRVSELLIVNL